MDENEWEIDVNENGSKGIAVNTIRDDTLQCGCDEGVQCGCDERVQCGCDEGVQCGCDKEDKENLMYELKDAIKPDLRRFRVSKS